MGKIKEILKYSATGLSQREIAAAAGSSLGTVNTVLAKIKEAGIKDPLALKEHELGAIVYPTPRTIGLKAQTERRPEPDLSYIHREMQRPGVTLTLLWEEYKTEHPDGLGRSQFCDRYYQFRKQNEVYMRKVYKAGDQGMVDWAGMTIAYTDRRGNAHKVYFFVAVLPATSLIYAEPFLNMQLEAWIEAHLNAFEYFGGVPRLLIPDNLKSAVNRVGRYESELNKTYVEMSRYYGTAILPARPREPRDKGPVENAVKIVEHKIIAPLRDRQFHSFPELRKEVLAAVEQVNSMPFQKLPGSRKELFEKTEQMLLKPLPPSRYEFAAFRLAKVNFDYHVQYEGFYYSVPFQYAHKQVEIRAATRIIEVFCGSERIAAHLRNYENARRYTTCFEHMPKKHQAMADWTPDRFKHWAAKIGSQTEAYIVSLMEQRDQPEQSFRTCAAILHLADTARCGDMEKAAGQALRMRSYSYKSFEIILKRIGAASSLETHEPVKHENIRGSQYYGEDTYA
jgi:transposase